jgi:hypothetical protein
MLRTQSSWAGHLWMLPKLTIPGLAIKFFGKDQAFRRAPDNISVDAAILGLSNDNFSRAPFAWSNAL